jgi:hypothetical protein
MAAQQQSAWYSNAVCSNSNTAALLRLTCPDIQMQCAAAQPGSYYVLFTNTILQVLQHNRNPPGVQMLCVATATQQHF